MYVINKIFMYLENDFRMTSHASKPTTVITFGTFDIFHIGHVNILKRARSLGDVLVVGISSDEMSFKKKKRYPIYNINERLEIVGTNQYLSECFIEEGMELKREYILKHKADILVMGDDWKGKFDEFSDICKVVYFPRTEDVSSTELIEKICDMWCVTRTQI